MSRKARFRHFELRRVLSSFSKPDGAAIRLVRTDDVDGRGHLMGRSSLGFERREGSAWITHEPSEDDLWSALLDSSEMLDFTGDEVEECPEEREPEEQAAPTNEPLDARTREVRAIVDTLLGDPEGCGLDNMTRAIHVLDSLAQSAPDAMSYFEGGLHDESLEHLEPDTIHDHPHQCAVIAAALSLMLRSLVKNASAGMDISDAAKRRFHKSGEVP